MPSLTGSGSPPSEAWAKYSSAWSPVIKKGELSFVTFALKREWLEFIYNKVKLNDSPRNLAAFDFLAYEFLPELMSLSDNILSERRVLSFAVECKLILWLSIWHFVELEPFDWRSKQSREELFDVLNVFQLISQRVVDVDSKKFPVCLAFINQSECSKNFNLNNVTARSDTRSNLTNVNRIVVTATSCCLIDMIGIFPSLRQSSVVPDVAVMRENVCYEAQLLLLDVLLDGIEWIRQRDLKEKEKFIESRNSWINKRSITSIFAFVQRGTSTTML